MASLKPRRSHRVAVKNARRSERVAAMIHEDATEPGVPLREKPKKGAGKDSDIQAGSHKRGVRGRSGKGGAAGKGTQQGQPKKYIINKILGKTKAGKVLYLVNWKGYKEKYNTW